MSFLAQLRQQQSDPSQGLKLCYLLSVNAANCSLTASLTLAELQHGHLGPEALQASKPYQLQQVHFQSPPPYLQSEDLPLLKQLLAANADWLASSCGPLPALNGWSLLQALVKTGRCFVQTSNRVKPSTCMPALIADVQVNAPTWCIDAAGEQFLRWQTTGSQQLFYLDQAALLECQSGKLIRLSHSLPECALEAVKTLHNRSIAPYAVEAFNQSRLGQWQNWGLPLPRSLPKHQQTASMTAVLHFRSELLHGNSMDSLGLTFRYCSEHYCTVITASANSQHNKLAYWDGSALQQLVALTAQEDGFRELLLPFLADFDYKQDDKRWYSNKPDHWRALLIDKRQQLQDAGFQFSFAAGFQHHYIAADQWQVEIQKTADAQWRLGIQLSAQGLQIDLLDILDQLRDLDLTSKADSRLLHLKDGRLLLLPTRETDSLLAELGDLLALAQPTLQFHPNQLNRLALIKDCLPDSTAWSGDTALLEQSLSINRQPQPPSGNHVQLHATLRPYQQLGVCWLQHLKQHNVQGLLADDMGLGKTIQTLAHLCLEKQLGQLTRPALIVAPTSLLHNWSAEITKFAPQLQFLVFHGTQRHQLRDEIPRQNLVITSYSLVARDLQHWQQQPLSWLILDEAQLIKNPRTRISQAVRQLESSYRLCLSGTPLENHLGELWSIFDFLMPNCLGSAREFNSYFRKPIEDEGDQQRFAQLLARIAPFMLRRTKDQVASDLPKKTEIYQSISMDDRQELFYQQLKERSWWELQEQLTADSTPGQQQFQVLTALLKLRQACCDPQLLGESDIPSAKRESCLEMISALTAENRAILVFSQFTSMLDLLADDLDKLDIPYLLLTGSSRNRQQLVDAFQAGEAPVFLISLKAGGVGLNLTRADTVIHYDPWWNNAAEQQATDRAHRIGQDKPVFVYKLIVENSIEEKISRLQKRKALLGEQVGNQAEFNSQQFTLKLEDLLSLWNNDAQAAPDSTSDQAHNSK